jgi:tyrosyl-tRNA synthetase
MARIPLSRLRPCASSTRTALSLQSVSHTRFISTSWLNKVAEGEERWAERAERIKNGEERHVWDVLEERGYIKDVAGYENTSCFDMKTRNRLTPLS